MVRIRIDRKAFSKAIKDRMNQDRLTSLAASRICGVNKNTFGRAYRGEYGVSFETYSAIVSWLGYPIEQFERKDN